MEIKVSIVTLSLKTFARIRLISRVVTISTEQYLFYEGWTVKTAK